MDKLSRRRLLQAGTAVGGLVIAGSLPAGTAHAAPAPRVYTREEWSARPPRSASQVLGTGPDHIVVHHTASANSTDYSLDQAFALSHWIQDLHMDSNGWADSGQQLTISRGGYVMEGRNRSLEAITSGRHCVGAQTAGHNNHTIGIENEGLYTNVDTTPALFDALVATCAWLCTTYTLDPHEAIVGHRDYVNTQCPGNILYARLPDLRDRVAAAL